MTPMKKMEQLQDRVDKTNKKGTGEKETAPEPYT